MPTPRVAEPPPSPNPSAERDRSGGAGTLLLSLRPQTAVTLPNGNPALVWMQVRNRVTVFDLALGLVCVFERHEVTEVVS